MSLIANLFGRSPIRPMQQHMHAAVACARAVLPLFEEMAAGNEESLPGCRLVLQAVRIKHEIRSHLPKRLMLAVERRDLLEILDFQDSIADTAQDVAGLADLRSMVLPAPLREPLLALVRRVIDACEHAQRIIDELDELLETGFSGREAGRVEEMITELSHVESDTDRLAEAAQRKLFALERELGVGTVFWNDLIQNVARMADYAERVGNRLRLLMAN